MPLDSDFRAFASAGKHKRPSECAYGVAPRYINTNRESRFTLPNQNISKTFGDSSSQVTEFSLEIAAMLALDQALAFLDLQR